MSSNTSPSPSPSIKFLPFKVDVVQLLLELTQHPELWNKHTLRTEQYRSPHGVDDIWVRYNKWDPKKSLADLNKPHKSVWYPAYEKLPAIKPIIATVMAATDSGVLGGVLITRIQPGKQVAPHADRGWHARHYNKYAVQLMGDENQGFYFHDSMLRPYPGDVYTFDNSKTHWVLNHSRIPRMTLIICARKSAEALN